MNSGVVQWRRALRCVALLCVALRCVAVGSAGNAIGDREDQRSVENGVGKARISIGVGLGVGAVGVGEEQ